MTTVSTGVVELRPSWTTYAAGLKARVVTGGALVVVLAARPVLGASTWTGRLLVLLGIAALVAICLGGASLYVRTVRVRLLPDAVEYHSPLLPDRRILLADHPAALMATMSQPMTSSILMLAVSAGHGRPAVRLNGGVWTIDQLEQVLAHVGGRREDETRTGREFEDAVPGSMPWRLQHPWRFGFAAAFVVLAAAAALATVRVLGDGTLYDRPPPQRVSAATAPAQGSLVHDLEAAVPGAWRTPVVRLWSCTQDSGRKGWSRHVQTLLDQDPQAGRAQVGAAAQVLRRAGLDLLDPHDVGGTTVLDAVGDGTHPLDDVEVQVGPVSSIEVTGTCERVGG